VNESPAPDGPPDPSDRSNPRPSPVASPFSPLPRVGIGLDVHALVAGRPLVLGGVEIPHGAGLAGHSDGDALVHAIIDALLGAAARGDIGQWFPSSDARWAGADSLYLLRIVVQTLLGEGWQIGNVDATVIAQQPRIGPHVAAMRERLGAVLGLPVDAISIKATTTDHLGALGRAEGIAAQAVALLVRR
jgi:2-C-methyl-D-erythritol 2,4-cyclodiphosphate synthase